MTTSSHRIWLKTLSGVPKGFAFGIVKYHVGAPAPANLNAALRASETSVAGWDAVLTNWERIPQLCMPGVLDHTSTDATLTGQILTMAGVEYDINEYGVPHPQGGAACCPEGKIINNEILVVFVEALGRNVGLIERGTKKVVVVYTTEPIDPYPGRTDSGIYRKTSGNAVVRDDR